jgi:hypothetical protein
VWIWDRNQSSRQSVEHGDDLMCLLGDGQEDAVKLANRVQQLKKEEEKAAKRIRETRKRAEEIKVLRKRNGACVVVQLA